MGKGDRRATEQRPYFTWGLRGVTWWMTKLFFRPTVHNLHLCFVFKVCDNFWWIVRSVSEKLDLTWIIDLSLLIFSVFNFGALFQRKFWRDKIKFWFTAWSSLTRKHCYFIDLAVAKINLPLRAMFYAKYLIDLTECKTGVHARSIYTVLGPASLRILSKLK